MRRRIRTAALAGTLATLAGIGVAAGPPRITLVNAGLRVDHPWTQGAGALLAAVGLLLMAAAIPRTWVRVALGALGTAALAIGLSLLSSVLEADDRGFRSRGWFSETTIPWAEVSRVQSGPEVVVVWGVGDAQVRVDTSRFRPEQRAALDRTIARRINESRVSPPSAPSR